MIEEVGKRPSGIVASMERLEKERNHLEKSIEVLTQRLGLVLREPTILLKSGSDPTTKEPKNNQCGLVTRIENEVTALAALYQRLNDLLEILDL